MSVGRERTAPPGTSKLHVAHRARGCGGGHAGDRSAAGDALDDSVILLLGLPAVTSALVTLAVMSRRGIRTTTAVLWAGGSALSAIAMFALLFAVAYSVDCAASPSCF